jgi:hypothetical protein
MLLKCTEQFGASMTKSGGWVMEITRTKNRCRQQASPYSSITAVDETLKTRRVSKHRPVRGASAPRSPTGWFRQESFLGQSVRLR